MHWSLASIHLQSPRHAAPQLAQGSHPIVSAEVAMVSDYLLLHSYIHLTVNVPVCRKWSQEAKITKVQRGKVLPKGSHGLTAASLNGFFLYSH